MEGLVSHTPMTAVLRRRGVFDRHPFVLIDVGCAGGIDPAWRAFGTGLLVHGFDPDIRACEDARAREPLQGVRYHAQFVGLTESHPFVQKRRAEAQQWPNTNIWDRVTAGALARRSRQATDGGKETELADPYSVIAVDEIAREHALPTVDFLKIDVDGPDLEVLESARNALGEQKVLGVGLEVNWFGTASRTEHTFHNTDRFMREHGYSLFGATFRPYSRIDLPAPFEYDFYAQTRFGQPYQGDAVYIRDLAAPYERDLASTYSPEKLLKLACIYELFGLPDCAAEVLNRFRMQFAPLGDVDALLDALTPPLLGEQLGYHEYLSRFHHEPESFLPNAGAVRKSTDESPTAGGLGDRLLMSGDAIARGLARRVARLLPARELPAMAQRRMSLAPSEANALVERFKSMYRLVDSPPFDLPFESWFDLYELVMAFQPDLALELGRGWGNSTCVLTEGANVAGFRVVSVGFDSEHAWETRTAPRLQQVVDPDWFEPLTVVQADIRTLDFDAIAAGSNRVLVFWDAHGVDVAGAVLRNLVPVLPVENRIVVDDIWPTPHLYGLKAKYQAGPLWSQFDELVTLWDYLAEHRLEPEIGHRWIGFTVRDPR